MREIGYQAHTPTRIAFWKQRTGPKCCYFHRSSTHITADCTVLAKSTARANASAPPDRFFVANISPPAPIHQQPTRTPAHVPSTPTPSAPTPAPASRHVIHEKIPIPPPDPAADELPALSRHVASTTKYDQTDDAFDFVIDHCYNSTVDYYFPRSYHVAFYSKPYAAATRILTLSMPPHFPSLHSVAVI